MTGALRARFLHVFITLRVDLQHRLDIVFTFLAFGVGFYPQEDVGNLALIKEKFSFYLLLCIV